MDNTQVQLPSSEEQANTAARVMRLSNLFDRFVQGMPIFDSSGISIPQKSFLGCMEVIVPYLDPRDDSCDNCFEMGLNYLIQHATNTFKNLTDPNLVTSDWFWSLVFYQVANIKPIGPGVEPVHIKKVIAFFTGGFKQGYQKANMMSPQTMKYARFYDSMLQWLWVTENTNYLIGIQGASFEDRDIAPRAVVFCGGDGRVIRPGDQSVPNGQTNSEDTTGTTIGNGQKRRKLEDGSRDQDVLEEMEALKAELTRTKAENKALIRDLHEIRGQHDKPLPQTGKFTHFKPELKPNEAKADKDKNNGTPESSTGGAQPPARHPLKVTIKNLQDRDRALALARKDKSQKGL